MSLLSFGATLASGLAPRLKAMDDEKKADAALALQNQRQATQDAQQATNFANQQTTFQQQQARLPIDQANQDTLTGYQLRAAKNKSADDERRAIGTQAMATLSNYGANLADAKNTPEIDDAYVNFSKQNKPMTDAGWDIEKTDKVGVFRIKDPSGNVTEQTRTPQDMMRSINSYIDPTKEYDENRTLERATAKDKLAFDRSIEVAKIGAGARIGVANIYGNTRENVAKTAAGASNYKADRTLDGRRVAASYFGHKPLQGDVFGNPIGNQPKAKPVNLDSTIDLGSGKLSDGTPYNLNGVRVGDVLDKYDTYNDSAKEIVDKKMMEVYGTDVAGMRSGGQPALTPPVKPYVINKAVDAGFKAQIKSLSGTNKDDATKAYGSLNVAIGGLSSGDPAMKQQAIEATKTSAIALAQASLTKGKDTSDPIRLMNKTVEIISNATGQSKAQVGKIFFGGQGTSIDTPAAPAKPTMEQAMQQRAAANKQTKQAATVQNAAADNLNKF